MISNGALELLKKLVDKYNSTGRRSFEDHECLPCENFKDKIIELQNNGLIEFRSTIYDSIELTKKGLDYEF